MKQEFPGLLVEYLERELLQTRIRLADGRRGDVCAMVGGNDGIGAEAGEEAVGGGGTRLLGRGGDENRDRHRREGSSCEESTEKPGQKGSGADVMHEARGGDSGGGLGEARGDVGERLNVSAWDEADRRQGSGNGEGRREGEAAATRGDEVGGRGTVGEWGQLGWRLRDWLRFCRGWDMQ